MTNDDRMADDGCPNDPVTIAEGVYLPDADALLLLDAVETLMGIVDRETHESTLTVWRESAMLGAYQRLRALYPEEES